MNKAITDFRGRTYEIWYEKGEIYLRLWKFTGVPSIVYEAYSIDGNASWVLEHLEKKDEKVKNPFSKDTDFISYKLYPKKAYGLSEKLKAQLAMYPQIKMTEQVRDNLEIRFEWEDKNIQINNDPFSGLSD